MGERRDNRSGFVKSVCELAIGSKIVVATVLPLVTLAGCDPSDSPPGVGEHGRVKHDAFACYRRDDFEDFFKLLMAHDLDAEARFAGRYIPIGACLFLKAGTELVVDEHPFSDNFCVRPVGEIKCVWTNAGWVVK